MKRDIDYLQDCLKNLQVYFNYNMVSRHWYLYEPLTLRIIFSRRSHCSLGTLVRVLNIPAIYGISPPSILTIYIDNTKCKRDDNSIHLYRYNIQESADIIRAHWRCTYRAIHKVWIIADHIGSEVGNLSKFSKPSYWCVIYHSLR